MSDQISEQEARQVRAWVHAFRDTLATAQSIASRAGDAFEGSETAGAFYRLERAVRGFLDADPAFAEVRRLGASALSAKAQS